MPPRRRDDWAKQILTEWGTAIESLLNGSGIGYPKQSPIANLIEYGCSTFSGCRGARYPDRSLPSHLHRVDRLVAGLPEGLRRLTEVHYVQAMPVERIASQCQATPRRIRYALGKVYRHIDAAWDSMPD